MDRFDPPSDPFYVAHPCPFCDWGMEKEWRYSLDRICVNPNCENSPNHRPEEGEREPVTRDITLRFYRHSPIPELGAALRSDEIEITRNGVKRTYNKPNNARYNEIGKIVEKYRISLEVGLVVFTEINFQFDKEY